MLGQDTPPQELPRMPAKGQTPQQLCSLHPECPPTAGTLMPLLCPALYSLHSDAKKSFELRGEWGRLLSLVATNEESVSSPATSRVCPQCRSHRIEDEVEANPSREPSGDEGWSVGKGGTVGKHVRRSGSLASGCQGQARGPRRWIPAGLGFSLSLTSWLKVISRFLERKWETTC